MTMDDRPVSRYVSGAALVEGEAAHVLAEMLDTPTMRVAQSRYSPSKKRELGATWSAIRRAARVHERWSLAVGGRSETPALMVAPSSGDEITTAEAAELLGVTERRVRQLAAGGLGEKRHGRWILHRDAVVALAHRRSSA